MVLDNITVSMDDVRYMQQSCTAVVQTQNLGAGTLYVADSILSWLNPLGQGFKLEYPSIQLHAISRDTTTFPEHCLYLMVEGSIIGEELSSSDSEDRDPVAPISELRFVPDDKNALQDMYEAMCNAQALHPDAEDEESEDDGDWYGGGDADVDTMTPGGQAQLERLEAMLDMPQPGHNPTNGNADDSMETDDPAESGQFEDVDN